MKVLLTGQSGTGKSTILGELRKRGFATFDTDDLPGVTRLEIKATGAPAEWPAGYIDWGYYAWNWQAKPLRAIMNTPGTIFVGAIVGNQKEFYPLFDRIVVLTIDDDELYRRRTARTSHRPNDSEENIIRSVARNQEKIASFIRAGALPIANDRPVATVVDEILTVLGL